MLSPQALVRGIVKRLNSNIAPNPDTSNTDVALRMFPYGEVCTQPIVRKHHNLADEGTYFVANNAQTGIAPTYGTSFAANGVSPFMLLYNGNTAPSQGQNLYIDYIGMTAIAAMVSTTTQGYTAAAVMIDNVNRYSSAGSALTPTNPNMGMPANASGVSVYAGAIVATAQTGAARTIVGIRNIRPALSTTVPNVIGDTWLLNFGGVEQSASGQISITAGVANVIPQGMPPLIVPPGSSALFYMWFPVMSAPSAGTFAPEVGFWVR